MRGGAEEAEKAEEALGTPPEHPRGPEDGIGLTPI